MEQAHAETEAPQGTRTIRTADFYANIPVTRDFVRLTDARNFHQVPDDWIVLITDVVSSTKEIEQGRYKTINMVGASVIAAVKNAVDISSFPYVFGGDGASLALPDTYLDLVSDVAARVRRWAKDEFDVDLRAGCAHVSEIGSAGHSVKVARFAPSDKVDFAVFSGGGVKWLERKIKSGDLSLEMAESGQHPDLNGLSCRWSNLKSRNGKVVSLVIEPAGEDTDKAFFDVARSVIQKVDKVPNAGNPIPAEGPGVQYPPPGMALEARASRAGRNYWAQLAGISVQNLFAWALFRTGLSIAGFDPIHYQRQTGLNSDHRKFEDGLKMTFDCDGDTLDWLEDFLGRAKAAGTIRYGINVQSEAFLTCIVVSPMQDDHVHFVDGADGGYAVASKAMSN
ncbi:MAG: DUF3095 domain-containing protein [Pseudomonadota bacterium]